MPISLAATIQLAPDLFLDAHNRFHRVAPPGADVIDLGQALDLTEATKAAISGSTVDSIAGRLGSMTPMFGDTPGVSIAQMAEQLGIPKWIQELAGAAVNIATAVGVVVAAYKFAVELLEWQSVLEKKDLVGEMHLAVNQLYATTISGLWGERRVQIADWITQATNAGDALQSYLEFGTDGFYDALDGWDQGVASACTALLDQAYQMIPYYPKEHDQKEWVFGIGWLEVPASVQAQLQSGSPPMKRMVEMQAGEPRWDYRLFLGELMFAVTVRIAMMKALHPDFRSTSRYKEELKRIYDGLLRVQDQWLQSIQRTRDIDKQRDILDMIAGFAYLPVGAIDICTGLPGMYGRWTDFVWKGTPPPFMPSGLDLAAQIDWDATVNRAHLLRDQMYLALLTHSGYVTFRRWVSALKVLLRDPDKSETVAFAVRSTPFRSMGTPYAHDTRRV
jgi:hypothetical protein